MNGKRSNLRGHRHDPVPVFPRVEPKLNRDKPGPTCAGTTCISLVQPVYTSEGQVGSTCNQHASSQTYRGGLIPHRHTRVAAR